MRKMEEAERIAWTASNSEERKKPRWKWTNRKEILILHGFKQPQVVMNIIQGQNNWDNLSDLGGELVSLSIGSEIIVQASYELRIY